MKMGVFTGSIGRKAGGPETYDRLLLENLLTHHESIDFHVFCYSRHAIDCCEHLHSKATFHQLKPSSRLLSLSLGLPLSLKRSGVDLYHSTLVVPPFAPVPSVFTMHDVSMFTHPQFYPAKIRARLNPLIKRGLYKSRSIVCISEHCRQTTAEYFDIPLEKMSVVHLGVSSSLVPIEDSEARALVEREYGLHSEYLIYVGKLEARKNIVRLLESFAMLIDETGFEGDLVLVGRRYWDLHGIDETLERLGIGDRVKELGYVPDDHLAPLYSAAKLFIFPTLWEGFGIPVLEAMACGTPVVTSSVSSIPEVVGDAAVLVDPTSVESIAGGMAKVLASDSFAADLRARGLRRSAEFTWEKTARETVKVYEAAHAQGR